MAEYNYEETDLLPVGPPPSPGVLDTGAPDELADALANLDDHDIAAMLLVIR